MQRVPNRFGSGSKKVQPRSRGRPASGDSLDGEIMPLSLHPGYQPRAWAQRKNHTTRTIRGGGAGRPAGRPSPATTAGRPCRTFFVWSTHRSRGGSCCRRTHSDPLEPSVREFRDSDRGISPNSPRMVGHPAAVRRLPSVRFSKCLCRRLHREPLEPSAKTFRHSDRREPPNSRGMVVVIGKLSGLLVCQNGEAPLQNVPAAPSEQKRQAIRRAIAKYPNPSPPA